MDTLTPFGVGSEYSWMRSGCWAGQRWEMLRSDMGVSIFSERWECSACGRGVQAALAALGLPGLRQHRTAIDPRVERTEHPSPLAVIAGGDERLRAGLRGGLAHQHRLRRQHQLLRIPPRARFQLFRRLPQRVAQAGDPRLQAETAGL
eukprot:gene33787-38184_t